MARETEASCRLSEPVIRSVHEELGATFLNVHGESLDPVREENKIRNLRSLPAAFPTMARTYGGFRHAAKNFNTEGKEFVTRPVAVELVLVYFSLSSLVHRECDYFSSLDAVGDVARVGCTKIQQNT